MTLQSHNQYFIRTAMKNIPADCLLYSRSPTFTQDTLPAALRRDHSTKLGTWALIHVLKGTLRYVVYTEPPEVVLLDSDNFLQLGIIEPAVLHHVEPVGELLMFVEFYRVPQ
jgi:tellurite methyltransferase